MTAQDAGDRLKQLREARGYTITQLAKRAGVSHTTIRNYERGARENGSDFTANEGKVMKVAAAFPPEDRATILEAFGLEERARNAKAQAETTAQPVGQEGQQFTVVGVVADSTDTIIVQDEEGRHRIFRELKLGAPTSYGPTEAPF